MMHTYVVIKSIVICALRIKLIFSKMVILCFKIPIFSSKIPCLAAGSFKVVHMNEAYKEICDYYY